MKATLVSLAVILFVPCFALGVFQYASHHYEKELRSGLLSAVSGATSVPEETKKEWTEVIANSDFNARCLGTGEGDTGFVKALKLEDDCRRLWTWRAGSFLAEGFLAILVAYFAVLFICVRNARRSRHALIRGFRLGWYVSLMMAVFTILVIGFLGTLSFYDFTVVLTNRYFPKLLAIFALGAVVALWQVVKTVFQKVPLEFNQGDAHSVSEAEAPHLWERVRAIASKVGTAPPTEIIVGSELNFFVTELAVVHMGGRSTGRILYLSSRLMKILSEEEVESVIGHELGHFHGADTELSLQFYPFWLKTALTQEALFSHVAAFPAAMLVRFFSDAFAKIRATYSRLRELEADKMGAMVASPGGIARALVKMQIQSDAFLMAYSTAVQEGKAQMPEEKEIFRSQVKDNELWNAVGTARLSHPIDSHPPTAERLAALGTDLETLRREIENETVTPAFDVWFGNAASVRKVEEQHQKRVTDAIEFQASKKLDASTTEGRAHIEKFWPKREWKTSKPKVMFYGVIGPAILGMVVGFLAAVGAIAVTSMTLIGAFLGGLLLIGTVWFCQRQYQRLSMAHLTLEGTGLSVGTWTRQVSLKEIASLQALVNNGVCTMTLHLKEPSPNPNPYAWRQKPVKKILLNLSLYQGDYNEIYGAIYGYWENLHSA